MCVIIAMVMQTTLMDQLNVLLNPSTGLCQKGTTRGQRTLNLNYSFLPYGTIKSRCRWISHMPHTNMPRTDIW